ncbi:MAG: hypothetical protein AAB366_03405 [Patescibacteria group bacterium]
MANQDSTPPPPPDNIEIRTMASDIKSIKESGGDLTLIQPVQSVNETKNNSKIIILTIGILIATLGLGFLAYYLTSKLL